MLKLEADAAAAPFLQHALVAAARAEPEGRTTHAMAESRAAVAANLTTARASAEKLFFFRWESTALTALTDSGRKAAAWIWSGEERRDLSSMEEERGAAAPRRVDGDCLDDEIDAFKPLV